ncbi:MAG: DUF169 domain-containing protein [archaeon]|nr:DUF169 domain-containing protein [archaeon]
MSQIVEENKRLKIFLRLRHETVACKLVREGEEFPQGIDATDEQITHCQAVFNAKDGKCYRLAVANEACHVGAAVLGMMDTPEKVASGEFHGGMGMHDSVDAAKKMIDARLLVPFKTVGEVVCPLKDADFVPDVVIFIDVAERIYWFVPLETAEKGGRAEFSTAPFQCCCEDVMAVPMVSDRPNLSLGCFGCRKRTTMQADEMAMGVPYNRIAGYVARLDRYENGIMAKAKRD